MDLGRAAKGRQSSLTSDAEEDWRAGVAGVQPDLPLLPKTKFGAEFTPRPSRPML